MTSVLYGFDVAAIRADDLDKRILSYIAEVPQLRVLDIGCGRGGQAARMALAGAHVLGCDIANFSDDFAALRIAHDWTCDQLDFVHGSMVDMPSTVNLKTFDALLMQRVLHYIPYGEAVGLLGQLAKSAKPDCTLYLAVTGVTSAIGVVHERSAAHVTERFTSLPRAAATTFGITAPLCPYAADEVEELLTITGWEVTDLWVSAFGNIKAVATNAR